MRPLCERIGEQDNMMDTAEIFHLWGDPGNREDELPLQKAGFRVIWTDNVDPYKKRKVRIFKRRPYFYGIGSASVRAGNSGRVPEG